MFKPSLLSRPISLGLIGICCFSGAPVQAFEAAGGIADVPAIALETQAIPASPSANTAASTAAPAISITPGQRALIEELLILTRQEELFNQTMALSMDQVRDSLPAILDSMLGESVDAEALEASEMLVDSLLTQLLTGLQARIQFSDIAEEVYYPLYAKNFSEAQLQDMIDFYETPTGKHTIAVMPQLVQDSMALTQARLMPVLIEVLQEVMGKELGGL